MSEVKNDKTNKENKDKKAELSGFQFTSPNITNFKFTVNKNYDADQSNDTLPISYNVKRDGGESNQQLVSLNMTIGNEKSPFTFNATIEANFRWSADLDADSVENLLDKNAVSLLIGYLRPVISQFTVQAGMPPLNLPFIDLTK